MNGTTPISYAAAVAKGSIASGIHSTEVGGRTPTQTLREATVSVRNPVTIRTLTQWSRALSTRRLSELSSTAVMTVSPISRSNPPANSKAEISGVRTTSNGEAQTLQAHTKDWAHRVGADPTIRNTSHNVLAHGLRASSQGTWRSLRKFGTCKTIARSYLEQRSNTSNGWLGRRRASQRRRSSSGSPSRRCEPIIDEGLVWQGRLPRYEWCQSQCRLKQCFN